MATMLPSAVFAEASATSEGGGEGDADGGGGKGDGGGEGGGGGEGDGGGEGASKAMMAREGVATLTTFTLSELDKVAAEVLLMVLTAAAAIISAATWIRICTSKVFAACIRRRCAIHPAGRLTRPAEGMTRIRMSEGLTPWSMPASWNRKRSCAAASKALASPLSVMRTAATSR